MKKLLLITAASLSLIASTSTLAQNPKVTICPGVSALQSVKFDMAREVNGKWQAGVLHNNFDTDLAWTFLVEGFVAKDANDAINIANEAAKSLSFVSGPTHVKVAGYEWDECEYTNAHGYESFAYTPAIDGNASLKLLR
jgi:hypothetical protein